MDMRKVTKGIIAAAVMTVVMTMPVFAGTWGQDETGYWYQNDSGSYARDQFMNIDGVNYAFNPQAYMVTGWYNHNGSWYYFDPATGAQVTGWLDQNGTWYYLNPSTGAMQTSWLKQGADIYYFDESGAMKTGSFTVDGYYYFAETSGALRRNKVETEGGITIRYDEEGRQWYKNDENRVNSASGGDLWLPLLEAEALQQQRAEIQESNQEYIMEKKDDLYEEYKEEVLTATTSARRTTRTEKWVDKVNRQLSALYVPQEEIDEYVRDVKYGIYGNDDYYYDDYDDDYDYDYDYDD